jgi:hypothetical protein
VGIEQVQGAQRDRTLEVLEKILCQVGIEQVCRQAQHKRRELFEFCDLKKNPLRDLHRVAEHPTDSARGCLSRGIARRALYSPSEGEGRRIKSLRGLSV